MFYNDGCVSRCSDGLYQYNGVCVENIPDSTYFVRSIADGTKLIVAKCPH